MHKSLHNQTPEYLSKLFTHISEFPTRSSLRSAFDGNLDVPRTRLQFGERAFAVSGARLWNSLPAQLRAIDNFVLFKSELKTHLFNIAFYS